MLAKKTAANQAAVFFQVIESRVIESTVIALKIIVN